MSDDKNALSQEQIDALLTGGDEEGEVTAEQPAAEAPEAVPAEADVPPAAGAAPAEELDNILTKSEKDAIGEIGNISMGTAATTLSTLVNRKVEITLPKVKVQRLDDLKAEFKLPCVMLLVDYIEGFKGNNVLLLKQSDASILADLMMGGEGKPEKSELDEMSISAVAESMNQMMGAVATSMSTMVDKSINISPPQAKVVDLNSEDLNKIFAGEDTAVTVRFDVSIEGLLKSELIQIQPVSFAKELVESLVSKHAPEEAAAPAPSPPASSAPPPSQPVSSAPPPAPPSGGAPPPPMPPVDVQKADFPDFGKASLSESGTRNLDLLLDVNLLVTAELGRTKMAIKDILELGQGSVLELERFAGEPIDVLVNNRLIARAEVVVIDESFGVRITDIVSQEERLGKLSKEAE